MRNHHQPCSVTIPGPGPDRRHVQPQTGCAGRNRVTIRILGADRVRTHVFQGRSALADAARFLCRTFGTPAARRSNARTVTAGAPPMTAAGRSVPFRQRPRPLSRAGFARRISARLKGGRGGGGPGGDGRVPAVAHARPDAVRRGASAPSARPHPRRSRAGQDAPDRGAGGMLADSRSVHGGRAASRRGAGDTAGRAGRASRDPGLVPCLAGARGTGKTSLAVTVAEALGRTHVLVPAPARTLRRRHPSCAC